MTMQVPFDLLIEPLALKSQVLKFFKTAIEGEEFLTNDIAAMNFIGIRDDYPNKDELVREDPWWYLEDGKLSAFGIFAILFFGFISLGCIYTVVRRFRSKDTIINSKELDTCELNNECGGTPPKLFPVVIAQASNDGIETIENISGEIESPLFGYTEEFNSLTGLSIDNDNDHFRPNESM